MKRVQILLGGIVLGAMAMPALADDAYLRLRCDGDAADAVVKINGEHKGECPIDLALPEGTVRISVRKEITEHSFRVYEKEIFLPSGGMKRETVELGPVQFTPEGQRLEDERIAREKAEAEAAKAEAAAKAAVLAEQQRQAAAEAAKYGATADYIDDLSSKRDITPMEWTLEVAFSPVGLPLFTLSDLSEGKTKFMRAAADPAVFGNPDSMLARTTLGTMPATIADP